MLKYAVLASTALMLAAPAFAQAVPVVVELEGVLESYDHPSRTLTVMGMQVEVPSTATIHSPTSTRLDSGLANNNQWFKGAKFDGRRQAGFLGGTAIVIGTWDDVNKRIVAQDVFAEPTENVILGVVTKFSCSNAACDGATDYIRGNSAPGSTVGTFVAGPAMLPVKDVRMPAQPIKDEGGFEVDLTGANLTGIPFAAEGYYGDIEVNVPNGTSPTVSEKAFHYFIWDIADLAPQLLKTRSDLPVADVNGPKYEVAALRSDCVVGDSMEVRGNVHGLVSNAGALRGDSIAPNNGVVEVQFNQGGTLVRRSGALTLLDIGSPYAGFRIRFNTPVCPSTVNVRWLPAANAANGTARASQLNVPVEIR